MSRHWASLPERGTEFALKLIYWTTTHIGRPGGRFLLYPITLYFLLTATSARRASRQYLQHVLGRGVGYGHVFKHIHCFAATLLDRVYALAGEFDDFDIRIHNGKMILEQVESGRGCILLGSHLGSFEILRALGVQRRFPLKVLMNIDHNSTATRFFNALNPDIADTIIPIRGPETLLQVRDSLEQGHLIGVLGDRVATSEKTADCQFLGLKTRFPTGPMLIASLMNCPVILWFALYRGGHRYDIYFERLAERISVDRKRREQDLQIWTQRYAARLEHHVRDGPYNWFNFYDYWREDPCWPRIDARIGRCE